MAYVGTNYHGNAWQEPWALVFYGFHLVFLCFPMFSPCFAHPFEDPKICPTVEAVLFEALLKTKLIEDRQSCNFSRCGRTDKAIALHFHSFHLDFC